MTRNDVSAAAGGKTYIDSDVVISGKLDVAKDTTLAAKLDVNGASVKHDGVNIGKTHKHLHLTEFPADPTEGPQ